MDGWMDIQTDRQIDRSNIAHFVVYVIVCGGRCCLLCCCYLYYCFYSLLIIGTLTLTPPDLELCTLTYSLRVSFNDFRFLKSPPNFEFYILDLFQPLMAASGFSCRASNE